MSVAQVLGTTPLGVTFRRVVVGDNWDKLLSLVRSVLEVQLTEHKDSFVWTRGKVFSVQALYKDLLNEDGVQVDFSTWKVKVPLKIKLFLWYLKRGVVLTKDNLVR